MHSTQFSRPRLAILIGVPLAWSVLLWFHGGAPRDDIYAGLRDEVTRWQIVHAGTLVFIGLMGLAVYLLVRDLPGHAARLSRFAAGVFVLFYGAYEAVIGIATGALVQYANDVPVSERPAVAGAIQSLQDNVIVGDPRIVAAVGSLAWITAVIAAAVAYRRVGAPAIVSVLLGASAIVFAHPAPVGPVGLVAFMLGVGVLYFSHRQATGVEKSTPEPPIAASV